MVSGSESKNGTGSRHERSLGGTKKGGSNKASHFHQGDESPQILTFFHSLVPCLSEYWVMGWRGLKQ